MQLPDSIRDNLVWILIPILIAALAVVIALFVTGELGAGSAEADFVYPV